MTKEQRRTEDRCAGFPCGCLGCPVSLGDGEDVLWWYKRRQSLGASIRLWGRAEVEQVARHGACWQRTAWALLSTPWPSLSLLIRHATGEVFA